MPEQPYTRADLPAPDCNINNQTAKCVRVKFHFLNNTASALNAPSDEIYYGILEDLNRSYEDAKIRFTFDAECIHKATLTQTITNQQEFEALLIDQNDNLDPHIDMDWAYDYVNIYTFQAQLSGIANYARAKFDLIYLHELADENKAAHEMGHILSLDHTFGPYNALSEVSPINPQLLMYFCKDPTVEISPGQLACEIAGLTDGFCDTGLDPYILDLDGDNKIDRWKWVANCRQSDALTPSVADDCNDITTPWDVPVHNYMSYYFGCADEFTPCQIGAMHDLLDVKTYLLINCSNDPYNNSCTDIVVNSNTIWQNQTLSLCPGQKIVITQTGNLTLDNVVLTAQTATGPNSSCPNLFDGYWDGIYIEGRNTADPSGELIAINGTIIEKSRHGIVAERGFTKIQIDNSHIIDNRSVLDVLDFWPLSFASPEGGGTPSFDLVSGVPSACGYSLSFPPAKVVISNGSQVDVIEDDSYHGVAALQMRLRGANIYVNNSTIHAQNTNKKVTAIKSSRGRVSLVNGATINKFDVGIDKEMDIYNACYPGGLQIYKANITECEQAIFLRNKLAQVNVSYIEGKINIEGTSYGSWRGSKFVDSEITCDSTVEAQNFQENCFNNSLLQILCDNSLTYATCNTWTDPSDLVALIEDDAIVPSSWGLFNAPSGNKSSNESEWMLSGTSQIINYEFNRPNHTFGYVGGISGKKTGITVAPSCDYDLCPVGQIIGSISFLDPNEDLDSLNFIWKTLSDRVGEIKDSLGLVYKGKYKSLKEELDNKRSQASANVGVAISFLSESEPDSVRTLWISRANPILPTISTYNGLWHQDMLDSLSWLLASRTSADASSASSIVAYMKSLNTKGISLRELSQGEVDSLIALMSSTYGDYTNMFRSFVNMEYGIRLNWPGPTQHSSQNLVTHDDQIQESEAQETDFILAPNPTKDCFFIRSKILGNQEVIEVQVFDVSGRLMKDTGGSINELKVCMNNLPRGIYFIRINTQNKALGTKMIVLE